MMRILSFLCLFHIYGSEAFSNDLTAENAVQYEVLVNNEMDNPIDVYFFTNPALFNEMTGTYTNSLGTETVQAGTASQAKFTYTLANFAAAQKLTNPAGQLQTTSVALQPIQIQTDTEQGEKTMMTFDKNSSPVLGIPAALPVSRRITTTVVDGSFQIQTPSYPSGQGKYGIGLGAISDGEYHLASYTEAEPNQIFNVQPVVKFYIAIGRTQKGKDANFYTVSTTSALCDATMGMTTFNVVRTDDGKWRVNGQVQ